MISIKTPKQMSLVVLFVCLFSSVAASGRIYVLSPSDPTSILVYQETLKKAKLFYKTTSPYAIIDFKTAPSGGIIAIMSSSSSEMHLGGLGYALRKLVLVDSSGSPLTAIENVLAYTWSPSGDSLAYIRGFDYGAHEIKPSGVWVVSSKAPYSQERISQQKASDISWALHSGKIYTSWGEVVHEVDLIKKTTKTVPFKGICFSPNGAFVFKPNYEGEGFEVYETASNKRIMLNGIDETVANTYLWLKNSTLLIGDITYEKSVFDVLKNVKKLTFQGQVLDYDPLTNEIIYLPPENVIHGFSVSSSTMRKLRLE